MESENWVSEHNYNNIQKPRIYMYTDRELYYSVTTHLVIEEGDHVREDDFFGWREGRRITHHTLMTAIAHSPL